MHGGNTVPGGSSNESKFERAMGYMNKYNIVTVLSRTIFDLTFVCAVR